MKNSHFGGCFFVYNTTKNLHNSEKCCKFAENFDYEEDFGDFMCRISCAGRKS